jgi:hypothetical protein
MKQTNTDFIKAEMGRRGDSGARTAKMMGMSQPGWLKAMQRDIPFRIDNFVAYCNAAGYEVVVMPKEYVGMLNDRSVIVSDGQKEHVFDSSTTYTPTTP